MSTTTLNSPQPLLFLNPNPTKPHPTPLSLRFRLAPMTIPSLKTRTPHASLLSIPPIKPTTLLTSIPPDLLKTLSDKLLTSLHEFKTPLLAVANAVGKWVDLYHSVLIVRILLSWFPNMPWEKQPFSAIRDLCDPCLSFFRTIMPPNSKSRSIDFSPILAFVFFGVLSSFLKTSIPPPV